jgi:hypothetical protein
LIPGIHNLPTVGTSPLKRGAKVAMDARDERPYILKGGAGVVSSKTNSKFILPAM